MARPKTSYEFLTTHEKDGEKVYVRICPTCNKPITHKSKVSAVNSHRQGRNCYECAEKLKPVPSDEIISMRREKQSETMKSLRKTTPPWNKGLTKESCDIVKLIATKSLGRKHTEETKSIISKTSKERWFSGAFNDAIKNGTIFGKPKKYTSEELTIKKQFRIYRNRVTTLTRKVAHLIEGYDKRKRGRCGKPGAHQIDHIVTVEYGFAHEIPPEKIAELPNLRFIPWEENLARKYKNDKTS